jgi:hypothetical protein
MNPNYPQTIYKYRDWKDEFHKNVLLKNQLYLSSPKQFNDPFDCRIPIDYTSLDTFEKKEGYAKGYIERHQTFFIQNNIDPNEEYNIKLKELENIKVYQKKYEEEILFPSQDLHYGVLSMSTMWDSKLLWAHYADSYKGVCYGFNEEKMRNSDLFGKGGPVIYYEDDKFPFIDPNDEDFMKKGFIETHSKSIDWKYEDEYRLFKLFFPNTPSNDDQIKEVPNDFFTDITLGIMTSKEDRNEIIELAKSKNIKVYQSIKVPLSFKIERYEV